MPSDNPRTLEIPAYWDHHRDPGNYWPFVNGFTNDYLLSWFDQFYPEMRDECETKQGYPIGLCRSIEVENTWRQPHNCENFFYPIALHWWLNSTRWDRNANKLWLENFTLDHFVLSAIAQKRCTILLHNYWEGWDAQRWLEIVYLIQSKYPEITRDDFLVVSNNLAIKDSIRSVGIAFFQELAQSSGQWANIGSLHQHLKKSIQERSSRRYRFVSLNRRPSSARWATMTLLYPDRHIGLLSFGLYTDLTDNTGNIGYLETEYKNRIQSRLADPTTNEYASLSGFSNRYPEAFRSYLDQEIQGELPLIISDNIDIRTNPNADNSIDKFISTYLHIVTETYMDNTGLEPGEVADRMHFSEKTFKPIWYLQPFVLCAEPHALKYLRSLGYETFGRWIDETYDDILDNQQRIATSIAAAKKFYQRDAAKIDDDMLEMLPVLQHNYQCLCNNAGNLPSNLIAAMNMQKQHAYKLA